MGKDNNRAPDFQVPIPYISEDEKEADPFDGKPPSFKLLLDAKGKATDNLTIQVQPIFNGSTTEKSLSIRRAISRRKIPFGTTSLTRN
jgi:hypothetical protein